MTENSRVDKILALAHRHGLQVEPTTAKINESGLDFLAVFANTADGTPWVLRVPRRQDVVETAAYEKKVLDLIRDDLPVAVPNWKVHTPEIIAYPMLQGIPSATTNLELKQYDWYMDPQSPPPVFMESLAEAMAALHNIGPDAAANAGVRVWQPDEVRQELLRKIEEIQRVFGISEELLQRWQTWIADDTFWPNHSGMVHGDLHPGHILVDPNFRVTGLLDWTEGEVSDPALDFTVFHSIFGESVLSDLLERYQRAGGRVWPRMKEHIVERVSAYPIAIATFALRSGLEEYMTMARITLGVNEQG